MFIWPTFTSTRCAAEHSFCKFPPAQLQPSWQCRCGTGTKEIAGNTLACRDFTHVGSDIQVVWLPVALFILRLFSFKPGEASKHFCSSRHQSPLKCPQLYKSSVTFWGSRGSKKYDKSASAVAQWLSCIVGNIGTMFCKGRRMCGIKKVIVVVLLDFDHLFLNHP